MSDITDYSKAIAGIERDIRYHRGGPKATKDQLREIDRLYALRARAQERRPRVRQAAGQRVHLKSGTYYVDDSGGVHQRRKQPQETHTNSNSGNFRTNYDTRTRRDSSIQSPDPTPASLTTGQLRSTRKGLRKQLAAEETARRAISVQQGRSRS